MSHIFLIRFIRGHFVRLAAILDEILFVVVAFFHYTFSLST